MSEFPSVSINDGADMPRRFGQAINFLLGKRRSPFVKSKTVPANPEEGDGYYDLTTHTAYIWNGSLWKALW